MEPPHSEIQYEQAHITDNAVPSLIATNIFCLMIAGSAVVLRLISRRLNRLSLGIDDYMAVLAMVRVDAIPVISLCLIYGLRYRSLYLDSW